MDGLRSFYKDRDALQQLVESDKVAFVQAGDPINFHEDYHCKVSDSHHQIAHEFPISLIVLCFRYILFGKVMFLLLQFLCI